MGNSGSPVLDSFGKVVGMFSRATGDGPRNAFEYGHLVRVHVRSGLAIDGLELASILRANRDLPLSRADPLRATLRASSAAARGSPSLNCDTESHPGLLAMSDPRVFFAAERTLLAWIRTGLTIIGFGFVVARFGLFLNLIAAQRNPAAVASTSHFSNGIGIALVLLGTITMVFAAIQHSRYVTTLPVADLPPLHNRAFPVALALVLGLLGLFLAVYLAL